MFRGGRRIAATALTAGAVLLGLPAAAASASGVITVTSAGSPARHAGELTIGLEATSPIKPGSVSATLYAPHASKAALKVTGFRLIGGSNTGPGVTTWRVKSSITQKQLSLGYYSITVHAADTGGDTVNKAGAGTLAFVVYPAVSLLVSPTTYSYLNNVKISGTDIGLYPGGKHLPVAGQLIALASGVDTTTNSSGNWSMTLQAGAGRGRALAASKVIVRAFGNKTTAAASSGAVRVTIDRDPVYFSGVTASPVSYGGNVTFSGIAWFEAGGTPLRFAGAPIEAAATGDWGSDPVPAGSATTSTGGETAGQFSVTIKGVTLPEQYTVGLSSGALRSPWFGQTASTLAVRPSNLPVADTLSARQNVYGTGYFSACVALSNPKNEPVYAAGVPALPSLLIYYNAPAGWTSLASGAPGSNGCFSTALAVPGLHDYYKVITDANGPYQAGSSQELQATQPARSSIVRFGVRPRRLRAGRRVTVSGTLKLGSSAAGRGVRVQIIFLKNGSRAWHVIADVRTNSSGGFSERPLMRASGRVAARYTGAPFVFGCPSPRVTVRVLPARDRRARAADFSGGGHVLTD
jgi:hypothetical protein